MIGSDASDPGGGGRRGSTPWWLDLLGLAWVVTAAVAVLLPALLHGASLGPYGLIYQLGLARQHAIGVRNPFGADLVTQMIPWTSLAWSQVHHGQLPLWNPYSALGTPLAFNWQSAAFSLPALLGYLFPIRLAYTVQVLATLVIGGTGVYLLSRVLRLSVLSCAFAATVFELSGSFIGWLGWPVSSVVSWSGWILAAAILVLRGRNRTRSIAFFSLVLACAVYAGQPDTLVLLAFVLAVFVIILAVVGFPPGAGISIRFHRLADLVLAALAGLALSAPLLLPGLQLLSASSRDIGGGAFSSKKTLPVSQLVPIMIPGLNGSPVGWQRSYIGTVAVILAVVGFLRYRRRPEVIAVGGVVAAAVVLCFIRPVDSVLYASPFIGAVRWARSTSFIEFGLAVLAGVGMDVLIRWSRNRALLRLAGILFSATAVGVLLVWLTHPRGDSIRRQSLLWAGGGALLGMVLIGVLEAVRRRSVRLHGGPGPQSGRRVLLEAGLWAGVLLFAFQASFQIVAGTTQWSSIAKPFRPTPAERQLEQTVGPSTVGLGVRACRSHHSLGIPANVNVVFGVHELAAYDPMLPRSYYEAWLSTTGRQGGYPGTSRYCPAVTSAALARLYGASFILELHGAPGPKGAIFVKEIGGEDLYRVPDAGQATLVPAPSPGGLPSERAGGTSVPVGHTNPRVWQVPTNGTTPQILRLRLVDVPGWHATIDGKPLQLIRFAGVMLQARIPPGHHTIELQYWPDTFTAGIVVAMVTVVALVLALALGHHRRTRKVSSVQDEDKDEFLPVTTDRPG